MTDKDKLLALLEDFGIKPGAATFAERDEVLLSAGHGGVGGYAHFECAFFFNPDGSFVGVEVWE